MPYSTRTAISYLQAKSALESLEFYYVKSQNKGPQLSCRIWNESGFSNMREDEIQKLADELNEAIQPVLKKASAFYRDKVRDNFPE